MHMVLTTPLSGHRITSIWTYECTFLLCTYSDAHVRFCCYSPVLPIDDRFCPGSISPFGMKPKLFYIIPCFPVFHQYYSSLFRNFVPVFRDHMIYAFLQILSCHTAVVAFEVFIHFLIYSKLVPERHNKNSVISRFFICTGDWLHSEGHVAKLYGTILSKMHNINAYTKFKERGLHGKQNWCLHGYRITKKHLSLHSKQLKTTLVYTVNHPIF